MKMRLVMKMRLWMRRARTICIYRQEAIGARAPQAADGQAAAARTADGVWRASSSAFSHWMVWCQSCRHGGHADHMREWFERHDECPVSGCSCRCSLRDSLPRSCVPAAVGA